MKDFLYFLLIFYCYDCNGLDFNFLLTELRQHETGVDMRGDGLEVKTKENEHRSITRTRMYSFCLIEIYGFYIMFFC